MAEDPRVRAENERIRLAKEQAQRDAIERAGSKSRDAMQRQIEADGRKLQGDEGTKGGCLSVFLVMLGAPAALVTAFKLLA
ncbi:hypothetical protein [Sphingobium sp. MK2]|uniref:hypothetical protein n=1 Tax=Sphingobium sp. MK2 TaxID=3116540 RepID=UPI0032E365B7